MDQGSPVTGTTFRPRHHWLRTGGRATPSVLAHRTSLSRGLQRQALTARNLATTRESRLVGLPGRRKKSCRRLSWKSSARNPRQTCNRQRLLQVAQIAARRFHFKTTTWRALHLGCFGRLPSHSQEEHHLLAPLLPRLRLLRTCSRMLLTNKKGAGGTRVCKTHRQCPKQYKNTGRSTRIAHLSRLHRMGRSTHMLPVASVGPVQLPVRQAASTPSRHSEKSPPRTGKMSR